MMPLRTFSFAVLGVGVLLSCSNPICACPPTTGHAIVYGSVRDAAGQPVQNALIQATIYGTVCGQGMGEIEPYLNPLQATATGTYRLYLHSVRGPRPACVRFTTRNPALTQRVDTDAALILRSDREQPDSTRIDFQLP